VTTGNSSAGSAQTADSGPCRPNHVKSRNKQSNSGSYADPSKNRHNPSKKTRIRVPPPQRIRIMQKYVAGESVLQIGREEGRNRETVARIVHSDEMQQFVRARREQLYGLGDCAIAALQHALNEEKDGRLAFQLLLHIGVIPSDREREALLREPAPENNQREQVKQIMSDLMEGAIARCAAYGMRLPEIEGDLKKVGGKIDYETGKVKPLDEETKPEDREVR